MTRTKRRAPAHRRAKNSKAPARKRAAATISASAIPERGLKIGEAATALGVATYVLRFWETQFPFLKPRHSRTRHRFYGERELEVLQLIKRLLHQEGFTIAGANKHIRQHGMDTLLAGKSRARNAADGNAAAVAAQNFADVPAKRVLSEVRRDLETLQRMLRD